MSSAPSTPLRATNLSALKVVELRAELATRNLSPKGVKKDLVKRLQDALALENGGEGKDGNQLTEEAEKEEAEVVEEEEKEEEEQGDVEGEKEGNGTTKGTKKTPKRSASAGNVVIEPSRRASGRKGSNVTRPSPLSKVPETPTRTTSRRVAATDSDLTNTTSTRASRGKRDQVMGDEEEKQEERQDAEKVTEEQGNEEEKEAQVDEEKDAETEEEKEAEVEKKKDAEMEEEEKEAEKEAEKEPQLEEKNDAEVEEEKEVQVEEKDAEMEEEKEAEVEKSVSEGSVQVMDAKTNDAVESLRKRTRSSDDEEEKPTEDIIVTFSSSEKPVAVPKPKETVQDFPKKDAPKVRDASPAKDATKVLPERTSKRRRKEGEEQGVDHDMENSKEQNEEHVEQRSAETEIPKTKTKTPVSSPQKVKRIYSPIKALTEAKPETKVSPISEESAIEAPPCEPSPCIYINGLHRPLTVVMLKKKLGEYGNVEKIWLDRIKTRCYALFSDEAAAVSARAEMNDVVWPPNTGRTLTVEYLPTHRYDELIAEEEKAMETGKKLVLTPDTDPKVAVKLIEMIGITLPPSSSSSGSFATHAPSASSGLPPALSGRQGPGSFGRAAPETRIRDVPIGRRPSVSGSASSPSVSSVAASVKLIPLDTLFRKTNAKPHLYYLPLTDEQVSERKITVGSGVADSRRN